MGSNDCVAAGFHSSVSCESSCGAASSNDGCWSESSVKHETGSQPTAEDCNYSFNTRDKHFESSRSFKRLLKNYSSSSSLKLLIRRIIEVCEMDFARGITEMRSGDLALKVGLSMRNLYDVFALFSSLGFIKKTRKNTFMWLGSKHLQQFFIFFKALAVELGLKSKLEVLSAALQSTNDLQNDCASPFSTFFKPKANLLGSSCVKLMMIFLGAEKNCISMSMASYALMGETKAEGNLNKMSNRVFRLASMLESLDILKLDQVRVETADKSYPLHVLKWTWNLKPSQVPLRPLNKADWRLLIKQDPRDQSNEQTVQFKQAIETVTNFFTVSATYAEQNDSPYSTYKQKPLPCSMFDIQNYNMQGSPLKCALTGFDVPGSRQQVRAGKFKPTSSDENFTPGVKFTKLEVGESSCDDNNNITQANQQCHGQIYKSDVNGEKCTFSQLPCIIENPMGNSCPPDTVASTLLQSAAALANVPKYAYPAQQCGDPQQNVMPSFGCSWNVGDSFLKAVNPLYQVSSNLAQISPNLAAVQYFSPFTTYRPGFVNNVYYPNMNVPANNPAVNLHTFPQSKVYPITQVQSANFAPQFNFLPNLECVGFNFIQNSKPFANVDFDISTAGVCPDLNDLEATIDPIETSDLSDLETGSPWDGRLSQCSNESNSEAYWNVDGVNESQSMDKEELYVTQNDLVDKYGPNNRSEENLQSEESLIWSSSPGEPFPSPVYSNASDIPSTSGGDHGQRMLNNETTSRSS